MKKPYFKPLNLGIVFSLLIIQNLYLDRVYSLDLGNVTVSGVVLSKNNCRFNSNNVTLSFGNIDGTTSSNATVSTNITFRCGGSTPLATFAISDNGGLYNTGNGQKRMRHQTVVTEFLPYTMNYTPNNGTIPRNTNTNLTIIATISANDIGNAIAGTYTDTVILSIVP